MKKFLIATLLSSSFAFCQDVKSPAQIQSELDQAQRDFEIAKSMFRPWYTGPLFATPAENVSPGHLEVQPYFFYINTFAEYDNHRCSVSVTETNTIQILSLFETGITKWLDVAVIPKGTWNWRDYQHAGAFNDLTGIVGFQIYRETPYIPSIRFTVGELFPNGKFERLDLNKEGIDAGGAGAYQTIFTLILGKVFWQIPIHPIRVRMVSAYQFPNHRVHVKSFNAYGGGLGTTGSVSVGHNLSFDLGFEFSISQKWVLATDLVYTYTGQSKFRGFPGINPMGGPASVGAPSSDQLSLAPAIEYNVSENGGFIGGFWFTMTGRNSGKFASLILSFTWMF